MLRISEVSAVYVLPPDLPAPEDTRARLDDLMRKQLPAACGRMLENVLDPTSPEIWFVRELSLDLALDLGAAGDDMAGEWMGRRLAKTVVRTLQIGPDGVNVRRFCDRAEYLAYFIQDVAAGTAWSQWIYRSFDSLRLLPPGTAIREALRREPAWIAPVLVSLASQGALWRIFVALSEQDAQLILDAVPVAESSISGAALYSIVDAWTGGRGQREALRLAVETRFTVSPQLIRAWLRFVDREQTLSRHSPAQAEDALLPLIDDYLATDAELQRRVQPIFKSAGETKPVSLERYFASPFGFVFLLIPHLQHIPSAEQRFDILLEICGAERAMLARHDPALRLASGLPESAAPTASGPLLEGKLSPEAEHALRAFTARLIAFRNASLNFVYANFFEGLSHIRVREGTIDVLLPLVPLRLVLRMAHFDDFAFQVSWIPALAIHIRLPEEA
jgi:hypothetical protein